MGIFGEILISFHTNSSTLGSETPILSVRSRSCYFVYANFTLISTHLTAIIACIRVNTLLNSFDCIEEINKMQRPEGSGRNTAPNAQSVVTGMSASEAAFSDGRWAATASGVGTGFLLLAL